MDKKEYIAFDQFQRYQTFCNLISIFREQDQSQTYEVLEIGANEHKDLNLFLPQDHIVFTDITLSDAMKQDSDFQQADGTNLQFADNSFDFVVAADVLEHVPQEKRNVFCRELSRVARKAVILCFPYANPDIEASEERLNAYYKSLYQSDFIWLKEHSVQGLPKVEEIETAFASLGCAYKKFFHGNLHTWENLWYCHFDTCENSSLVDYRKEIDHYYNTKVYASDVVSPCYRVFFVSCKDGTDLEKLEISRIWRPSCEKDNTLDLLLEKHRNLVTHFEERQQEDTEDSAVATLFWAKDEEPFQEGMSHSWSWSKNEARLSITHRFEEQFDQLRFDPMEAPCVVEDLHIYSNVGTLIGIPENGVKCSGKLVFLNADPRIRIETAGNTITSLEIRAHVTPLEYPEQRELFQHLLKEAEKYISEREAFLNQKQRYVSALEEKEAQYKAQQKTQQQIIASREKEIQELQKSLGNYTQHYHEAINQREELKLQLAQVQFEYQKIQNAFFWKLTKPARMLMECIKRPLRRVKWIGPVKNVWWYWRSNGTRNTLAKIKQKLFIKRQNKHPQIVSDEELQWQRNDPSPENIKFSILVPLYNTPEKFLKEMIESVIDQTYRNWELCLADGSDANHTEVERVCRKYCNADSRIVYKRLTKNEGISANTNACAAMASGDYLVLLDHDDILMPHALYANYYWICKTGADVLYSDEDHLSQDGKHVNPLYKPDWSPDLLYSQMYICHLLVFKRNLFEQIGGFRSAFDGSQDYDLMLRLSENTDNIFHIAKILYSWRESPNSTALNAEAKPYSHTSGLAALDEHLKRKYGPNAHAEETPYLFVYNPRFDCTQSPLVSIIIPMKDKWELTRNCVQSILEKTTYANYEILILDNRSEEEETKNWLIQIAEQETRISVVGADMEFNYSRLNNFGMKHANGDVYVFLNNDTIIISEDWLERLVENVCREDVGVVGAMLLYPDDTIQHAGVVVGFGGWADHVYKGIAPVHTMCPFVSPVLSRNVLAVTGACMAVSKKTIRKIGGFDERFIICGSDIELCLRAHQHGLFNRIDTNVRLYHLESKSRDTYIPEVDFQMSYQAYAPYREHGDPYYNINLDKGSVIPLVAQIPWRSTYEPNGGRGVQTEIFTFHEPVEIPIPDAYRIPEIEPLAARREETGITQPRLNLLIPSVDQKHVFGGISTALEFFKKLCAESGYPSRILVMDAPVNKATSVDLPGYQMVPCELSATYEKQIIPLADRHNKTIPVSETDIFVATGWWTAHIIAEVCRWQKETFGKQRPLIYFIQDYEPGFYAWSSRYMLADSTYRLEIPTYAVFNSSLLQEHFVQNGYQFEKSWVFDPVLNDKIKEFLPADHEKVHKKKQILIYGRPSVDRNAFNLIVYALSLWCKEEKDAAQWTLLSAGESHPEIQLPNNCTLRSVGKLSLEEYSKMLLGSYAGISLMVSPHPSYPPLEMATFGIKTITNCYGKKDLAKFNKNICSIQSCEPRMICQTLKAICEVYDGTGEILRNEAYAEGASPFEQISAEMIQALSNDVPCSLGNK